MVRPGSGQHITRFSDERARADRAEARAEAAEARISELEDELRGRQQS